ncbi:MAG: Gfo/Idh/MocA family protein [Armatimonadota bacterium]
MSSNSERQSKQLTRREFLTGSAATTATAFELFTESAGNTSGTQGTINAAIIGTGNQGCFLLERAIKIPNVRFVACCDIQEKNLARGLTIAKGSKGYSDYREVLERKDIDAVLIATPLHLHAPMTIDSLRSGKHVFCEKMMAYSIEEAKHMLRVARQKGLVLQIGHQRRYDPTYQHAHKLIREGVLGKSPTSALNGTGTQAGDALAPIQNSRADQLAAVSPLLTRFDGRTWKPPDRNCQLDA